MAWSTKVNVRMVGSNPIVKIINFIFALYEFLTGIRRSGELIEEDNHILINTNTRIIWFFPYSKQLLKVAKKNISAIKVSDERSLIIFRSVVVQFFASGTETTGNAFEVKCSYDEIKNKADLWV